MPEQPHICLFCKYWCKERPAWQRLGDCAAPELHPQLDMVEVVCLDDYEGYTAENAYAQLRTHASFSCAFWTSAD